MGRKCMVPDCLSEEGRLEDRGVTFHKIPLHSDIRPKWMSLCHISEDKYNIKVLYVCSRHFLKIDFCRFKGKRYMLRQGVLPSVFPWSKLKREPVSTVSQVEVKKGTTIQSKPKRGVRDRLKGNNTSDLNTRSKTEKDEKVEIKQEPEDIKAEIVEEAPATTSSMADTIGDVSSINKVDTPSQNDIGTDAAAEEIKNKTPKSSSTIVQEGKTIQTSWGLLNFAPNVRLEALDFNQMWFPAKIVEIDYEESEVLIHFERYSSKYDEWISMNSSRLRPFQAVPEKKLPSQSFIVGEKCLASWSDSRKFPALITKVIDNDTYEVLFNDGFVKILKGHRIAKTDAKSIGSAPLFGPALGTKQDRRDKKRKLNVAQLFRKRPRVDTVDEPAASEAAHNSSMEEPEMWLPRWDNGRPIGVESVIEVADGMRKSVIVSDPCLPPNWQKHLSQRTHGLSAGKWDTIIVSPEGRKFRTRTEIRVFLEENPHLNLKNSMFNFSLYKRSRGPRRLNQRLSSPAHELSPITEPAPPPQPVEEENSNSLKIPIIDDTYKCPIEGCGKSFRRENLAQMHVKHYHPEYTKYLDSTPNVADLAYARTVGESLDKSPDRTAKAAHVKTVQKNVTPKTSTPKVPAVAAASLTAEATEVKTPQLSADAPSDQNSKSKDSEILRLLSSKSQQEEQIPKYPPGLPSNMYPDIKLKDLLNKSEGIPKRDDLNLKSLSTSMSRPMGIKTLLPVIRTGDTKKDIKTEEMQSIDLPKPHSVKQSIKRKRYITENIEPPVKREALMPSSASPPPSTAAAPQSEQNTGYIVEGGEVIKIVTMKREEIINCTCGITEEDGLMIQCELCLCWQHAYCNNIERENQVPEKYICSICQNPMRQRSSKKYFHDQDWLKNGTLPVGSYHCKDNEALKRRFDKLKKSHDLSGALLELKDFMHSLKVKLKIAEAKNHPKLYLWSKQWEKHPLPEKIHTNIETEVARMAEELKPKLSDTETQLGKSDIDLLTVKSEPSDLSPQNPPMLFSMLKSPKEESLPGFPKLDLNTLIETNLEQLPPISAPQPEAAIESADCKLNLLDHIAHCQNLVEERLDNFAAQVDVLDTDCPGTEEEFTRTCQTIQMLLRDLNTLKELSHSNSL